MGADIHMFIHYKEKDSSSDWWRDFGGNINPGRDYTMFGVLAGVRIGTFDEGLSPKGLPEHSLSWAADEAYYVPIYEKENESDPNHRHNEEGRWEVSVEYAKTWESYGRKIIERGGKPVKISNPDWHSASWLTTKELSNAYRKYNSVCKKEGWGGKVSPVYKAILHSMRALEDNGNNIVEVVFWFDN
jgi:hypothetical protein